MEVEAKVFFTCIIFLLVTILIAPNVKDVAWLAKEIIVVVLILSVVGIVSSLIVAIWSI